jgi:hypothetical protein
LSDLEVQLKNAVEEIWQNETASTSDPQTGGWAARMKREKQQRINPVEKVPKPAFSAEAWRLHLLELVKRT